MKAISLFSGAGGFECGFEKAGIRTVLQAESDPVCLSVLKRHWPAVDRLTDVRDVVSQRESAGGGSADGVHATIDNGRRQAGSGLSDRVDLVYGGWPCQGNSVAGKRGGLSDERSGLWHEVRRVLRELRPRWFVGENVPGLLSVNRGLDFLRVLMDLDDLGYGVAWRTLDARFFGVPQRRRRVFLVGCLGDARRAAQVLAVCEGCGGHPPPRTEEGQGVAYALSASVRGTGDGHGNAWNSNYIAGSGVGPEAMRPLTERSTGYRMDAESENFIVAATLSGGGHAAGVSLPGRHHEDDENLVVAGAQRASDGHHGHSSPRGDGGDNLIAFDWQASAGNDDSWRGKGRQHVVRSGSYAGAASATRVDAVASGFGVRRLTPLECERLQGFPDEWTRWGADGKEIADSHRYRLMGNAVATVCAQWLGYRLVEVDRQMRAKERSHS